MFLAGRRAIQQALDETVEMEKRSILHANGNTSAFLANDRHYIKETSQQNEERPRMERILHANRRFQLSLFYSFL